MPVARPFAASAVRRLGLLAGAIALLAGCAEPLPNAPNGPPAPDPEIVRKTPKPGGALMRVHGLLAVSTSGTPYDEGFQHGSLLREEIRSYYRDYYRGRLMPAVPMVIEPMWGWYARSLARSLDSDARAELRGLADGAQIPEDWALVLQANPPWQAASSWWGAWPSRAQFGSDAFLSAGRTTIGGVTLMGANLSGLDFGVRHRFALLQVHHPAHGHAFVTAGVVGRVLDAPVAWNDRGLMLAATDPGLAKENASGLTSGALLRRIAQRCATVAEADRELRAPRVRASQGLAILVADAHDARSFEIGQTMTDAWHGKSRIAMRPLAAHSGAAWIGTAYLSRELQEVALPEEAGRARSGRLGDLLARNSGRLDATKAMELLCDRIRQDTSEPYEASDILSLFSPTSAWKWGFVSVGSFDRTVTTQSAVLNLEQRMLYLAQGIARVESPAQFVTLSLADLLTGSSSIPVPVPPVTATGSVTWAPRAGSWLIAARKPSERNGFSSSSHVR